MLFGLLFHSEPQKVITEWFPFKEYTVAITIIIILHHFPLSHKSFDPVYSAQLKEWCMQPGK